MIWEVSQINDFEEAQENFYSRSKPSVKHNTLPCLTVKELGLDSGWRCFLKFLKPRTGLSGVKVKCYCETFKV